MNINFILTSAILAFTSIISLEGWSLHYCIRRCNGREVYVWNNMHFNSYREMMDCDLRGVRLTTTTQLFLAQTNRRRKLHGIQLLKFNQTIADTVQKWAEECARANEEKYDPDHTYTTNYGGFSTDEYRSTNETLIQRRKSSQLFK